MIKKVCVLVMLLAVAATGRCQLKSVGEVPADLKKSMSELYEADLQRAETFAGGSVKDKNPLKEASYRVGKMMASGRIVYGDPVSRLASRIADTLLKDYPSLRSELRFYTVKSPEVNAFSTGQGMVFVNAGLMAQVEDEAQLAFVLSHEIIHYFRNHIMEKLVGGKDKKRPDSDKERDDMNEFLRQHSRSREMESEADSLGIVMFYANSPYCKEVTDGVFDVLQYGALPFDDVPFDTTIFNTPYYKLTGCWLKQVAPISSRDDYDDSRSSHPNILSRRHHCAAIFDGRSGGAHFVVSTREEFEQIRHMARLECIRQELVYGEYSRAFYNSWVLLRDHPDDALLNRYMAQAIYGIAMSKVYNGTNAFAGDYNKIEGESQQVYYAMRQMSSRDAVLAALRILWQQRCCFPAEEAYVAMCNDLMEALHGQLKLEYGDFLSTPPSAVDTVSTLVAEGDKPMTKYERIKQKRQSRFGKDSFAYALTDLLMTDSLFASEFKIWMGKDSRKETQQEVPKGDSLGTVILYSPSYWVVDDRDDKLDVDRSDRMERSLTSRMKKMVSRHGCKSIDFSDEGLHAMTDAEQYNDFVVLNEWVNEFWQNKGQYRTVRLMQPEMNDVLERYGASAVCMTAVKNTENLYKGLSSAFGIIFLPLSPVVLYSSFSHTQSTVMENVVADAREGKIVTRQDYSYNVSDQEALLDGMLYDSYARVWGGESNPVGLTGYRFSLSVGANLAFSGKQPFEIGKAVTITPWVNLEYALTRKITLTAGWARQGGFEELNRTTADLSKDMTTWNLTARFYSNTDFAPLGPYIGAGMHWVHFTNMSDGSSGGNTFGIHLSFGRNYVFLQRLLFNIEARYSYTYGFMDFIKSFGHSESRLHIADAVLANVMMLRMGIGVLPF